EVQAEHDLLLADSIAVSPAHPKVGEPVTLTVTARNSGTIDTHGAELELYIGARKVSTQRFDLMAGQSKRIATTWTPTTADTYELQPTIDAHDEPYASDFHNNTQRAVVRVR